MSEIFEVGDRVLYVSQDARRIVCGVVEVVDGNRVVVETGERKLIAFSHELTKLNMPDDFTKVDYVADIIARKIRERMMETPYKFTSALSPEDAERIGQANKAYGNLQQLEHVDHDAEKLKTPLSVANQVSGLLGKCPNSKCGFPLNVFASPHFCGFCGQAIKWQGDKSNE